VLLTLHAGSALVFDVPACGASGCKSADGISCTNRDPRGPAISCYRNSDEILVSADVDEIVNAVGSTTVAADLTCAGADVPDAGQSDVVEEVCVK
jgi:hypothetical protein